jgi:RHS repeat-associated protein
MKRCMSRKLSLIVLGTLGAVGTFVLNGLNSHVQAASFRSRISIQLSDHARYYREGSEEQLVFTDHLGTSKKIVGNEMASLHFPYGQVYGDELPESVPAGYTGQRRLPQTATMYYKARFYNTELGVFIQPDSVEKNADSYAYVKGDPISRSDPTGNASCRMCGRFNPFFSPNSEKFPDERTPVTDVKSFFKANLAGFLSSIGVLGFLPETSINQYISKNENMNNFMMATAPVGVMSAFRPRPSRLPATPSTFEISVEGVTIPIWRMRSYRGGGKQNFDVNTIADHGLQAYYKDIQRELGTRGTYESRASIVQRVLERKVDYSVAAEEALYGQGAARIGDFYKAGNGVCLEMGCLAHLGLHKAGKRPSYLITVSGDGTKFGHGFAVFEDTVAREWFAFDPSANYLGPINARRDFYLDRWTDFVGFDMTRK